MKFIKSHSIHDALNHTMERYRHFVTLLSETNSDEEVAKVLFGFWDYMSGLPRWYGEKIVQEHMLSKKRKKRA